MNNIFSTLNGIIPSSGFSTARSRAIYDGSVI